MSRDRGQSNPGRVYCTSRGGSAFGGQLVRVSEVFMLCLKLKGNFNQLFSRFFCTQKQIFIF